LLVYDQDNEILKSFQTDGWLEIRRPLQKRAQETFDLILDTAGVLLSEIGFENLSTNAICRHAGVSPPALYRYFPNKYAVLNTLATRLMEHQNVAYRAWLEEGGQKPASDWEDAINSLCRMQESVNAATAASPGAAWIMRAMRAVPELREVRLASHEWATNASLEGLRELYPTADPLTLRVAARLSTETMYAASELVFDEPELDARAINREVSEMIVRYFDKFS